MSAAERRQLARLGLAIAGLHLAGGAMLLALAGGTAGAITVGAGLTAYTLGLRHAFDADHIAAIDNTTRKLMGEGRRPLSVGFFFALGHSTVVLVLALLLAAGVRALGGAVQDECSPLQQTTGLIGTLVSGSFLYAIGILNLVLLIGIVRVFRRARRGELTRRAARGAAGAARPAEPDLRAADAARAQAVAHVSARRAVRARLRHRDRDRAARARRRRVVLRACRSTRSSACPCCSRPAWRCSTRSTARFMGFAYDWALARPVRQLYYNLTVTGLSVAVALGIGTIELLSSVDARPQAASTSGRPRLTWSRGLFALTWAVAVAVWRLGRIEQRWALPESR